jgi:hypothetical protein
MLGAIGLIACTSNSSSPVYEGLDGGGGRRPMTKVIGPVPEAPSVSTQPKPPPPGADAGFTAFDASLDEGGLPLVGDAGIGCRAPDQFGCATCCEPDYGSGSCVVRSGTDWYSDQAVRLGPCPLNCAPCATCTVHDEQQLLGLQPRPSCDCTLDAGPASCTLSPGSCNCYCAQRADLVARCGTLTP